MTTPPTHGLTRALCPRCGTTECFGPDDKSCSDLCIRRYQQENAALRAELAASQNVIESVRVVLGLKGIESRPIALYVDDLRALCMQRDKELGAARTDLAQMTQERDEVDVLRLEVDTLTQQEESWQQQLASQAVRIKELEEAWSNSRDSILNQRHQLEGYLVENYIINAVLGILDDNYPQREVQAKAAP